MGEGLEERKQALEEMWEEGVLKQVPEAREKHYKLLCKDILQERSRIGGMTSALNITVISWFRRLGGGRRWINKQVQQESCEVNIRRLPTLT